MQKGKGRHPRRTHTKAKRTMETTWKLQGKEKGTNYWVALGTFSDLDSLFDEYEKQLLDDMNNGESDNWEYREVRITNLPKILAL